MKKVLFTLSLLSGIFLPLCAQTSKMTVKIASIIPARSEWDAGQHTIAQGWNKVSGGQINLQFMNATAIGGEFGVIQKLNSVRPGQKAPIDGAIFTSLGMYDFAPESHIMTTCVPFLFRNQDEVRVMLDSYGSEMQKAISDRGYVVLGWFSIGWAHFFTKQPVHSITELKKLRLNLTNMGAQELSNLFKSIGFQTVDIAADKVQQSLKTPGGIEGVCTLPMYAYASQYAKTLPYALDVPLCPVMAAFVISKDTWAKIPDEWKKEFTQIVLDVGNRFDRAAGVDDADYLKRYAQSGGTLVQLSETEAHAFENDFHHDIQTSYESKSTVVDKRMYDGIVQLLKKRRGE